MLILAIDSATPVAGVALMDESKLVKEEFSNFKKNHSETLMPMVDRILKECGCQPSDLDAVAITVGPGSFTGLRIGMATAKGICMAGSTSLVGVSTLEVLAWNLGGSEALICPMLDARKGEIYAGLYLVDEDQPKSLHPAGAYSPEALIEAIHTHAARLNKKRCIMLGDAVEQYGERYKEALGSLIVQAPSHLLLPKASALASLAGAKLRRGETEDLFTLHPLYLRLSEAELKRQKGE